MMISISSSCSWGKVGVVLGVVLAILSILVVETSSVTPSSSSSFGISRSGGGGSLSVSKGDIRRRSSSGILQRDRRTRLPPNSHDPDYIHPTSTGGHVGKSGQDGAGIFITKLPAEGMAVPLELRAHYFARVEEDALVLVGEEEVQQKEKGGITNVTTSAMNGTSTSTSTTTITTLKKKEVVYQEYRVPGDERHGPYFREVTVKVWGAGGGGCDGGRGEVKDSIPEGTYNSDSGEDYSADYDESRDDYINYSQGSSGGYVEATFLLPVGDILQVTVGGGGMSQGSQSNSLGGKGGYNGGMSGRSDLMSGGGGGGGMSVVSWNGAILAAAFGGDGGGNTTYCAARGGWGGVLSDRKQQPMLMVGSTTLGGGGYINVDLALPSSDETVVRVCPSVPMIAGLSHESATFTWNAGSHQFDTSKEFYVQKYIVGITSADHNSNSHMDEGDGEEQIVCSSAFIIHEHIQRSFDVNSNATTRFDNLNASTSYCLRVEAFSSRGLSLGKQILPFHTKSVPINEWLPVPILQQFDASATVSEASASGGNTDTNESTTQTTWCEHSPTRPTGRRGHSMTVIKDHVYIFGGATLKCICDGSEYDANECSSRNVYSNELWHFETLTSTFSQLGYDLTGEEDQANSWPSGREQHSMTALPNGNLVSIGGLTSSNDNFEIGEVSGQLLLADVWTMRDPHHIIPSLVFSSNDLGESLPIELMPGHLTSHRLPIVLQNDDDDGTLFDHEEMCIHNIQVHVSLDRICPNAIEYIMLTGPVMTFTADHDALQSIDYETKIIVRSAEARDRKCNNSSSVDLHLSDDANEWVLSHAIIPETGSFRPANSLMATFDSLPINGEWKISIELAQSVYPEEFHGARLLQWELTFDAKSCAPGRPRWRRLPNPPFSFAPRRQHTAIAVDNSIFITGGFAKHRLNDLWRYDYDSNVWVELNHVSSSMRRSGGPWPMNHGQVSVLGPFGLLAFGGISKSRPQQQGHDLRLMNIFDGDWVSVHIISRNESNIRDGFHVGNDIPDSRYLSSIGLLNNVHSIYKHYNINDGSGPMILVFGGDGKLLHNAYPDSYGYISNSLFDDVWLLSPGGIRTTASSMYQRRKDENCSWRWMSESSLTTTTMTAYQIWNTTCGWTSEVEDNETSSAYNMEEADNDDHSGLRPGECQLGSIMIAAWCREQFQSFYMP